MKTFNQEKNEVLTVVNLNNNSKTEILINHIILIKETSADIIYCLTSGLEVHFNKEDHIFN